MGETNVKDICVDTYDVDSLKSFLKNKNVEFEIKRDKICISTIDAIRFSDSFSSWLAEYDIEEYYRYMFASKLKIKYEASCNL